jgi:hypothetical protein
MNGKVNRVPAEVEAGAPAVLVQIGGEVVVVPCERGVLVSPQFAVGIRLVGALGVPVLEVVVNGRFLSI